MLWSLTLHENELREGGLEPPAQGRLCQHQIRDL
jgi:hypothetical protein